MFLLLRTKQLRIENSMVFHHRPALQKPTHDDNTLLIISHPAQFNTLTHEHSGFILKLRLSLFFKILRTTCTQC
ncbi:hypothetical protein SAMN05216302_102215 [Nitrosomonas aestuarii]|uniref:Uncharacterized protein n=1 Tax=Nitrosomonas aestuarii TaxID=52441 RepID=A0A1I4DQD3_9PROT|nr:hypothetical protein SAMN05216302_102215 [Nitrosomonas aestuarii]